MDEEKLSQDLVYDEGNIPYGYTDSLGYLTIGVGFMIDKRKGGLLYPEEIDFILKNRIRMVQADLQKAFSWYSKMTEPRQRALCNMCFNLGLEKLSKFKNMLRAMADGDYQTAAAEAKASSWYTQVGARAKRICDLIEGK